MNHESFPSNPDQDKEPAGDKLGEDEERHGQESSLVGATETPVDEEFLVGTPEGTDVRSEQNHCEDEDDPVQPSEMKEPHVTEAGTTSGMAGKRAPPN